MYLYPKVIGISSRSRKKQFFFLFIEPVKKVDQHFNIKRRIEIMILFHDRYDHIEFLFHIFTEHIIRRVIVQIESLSVYIGASGKLGDGHL